MAYLLNIHSSLCAGFNEQEVVLVGKALALLNANVTLVLQITLVPHLITPRSNDKEISQLNAWSSSSGQEASAREAPLSHRLSCPRTLVANFPNT